MVRTRSRSARLRRSFLPSILALSSLSSFSLLAPAVSVAAENEEPRKGVVRVVDAPKERIKSPDASRVAQSGPNLATEVRERYEIDRSGNITSVIERTFTVLRDAGRAELSSIHATYASDETYEMESARVIAPDGKVTEIDPVLDVREGTTVAGYSERKTASLALPALVVGSRVALKVRRHVSSNDPGHYHFVVTPSSDSARVDRFEMTVQAQAPIYWKVANMERYTITTSSDKRQLRLHLNAPYYDPPVGVEGGTPHAVPRLEIADTDQMDQQFKRVSERFEQVMQAPLPSDAARFAVSIRQFSEQEQVVKAVKYLRENYRVLGDWLTTSRGLAPFPLAVIEQNHFGDDKDLSALLAAILRSAGLSNTHIALIDRGVEQSNTLIDGLSNVDHAIVRTVVDGQVRWIDVTNPVFLAAWIPDDLQERHAYTLLPNGKVTKEWVPVAAPSRVEGQSVVQVRPDGSARVEASLAMSSGSLLFELAKNDYEHGAEATNDWLCANSLHADPGHCTVSRDKLGTLVGTIAPPHYSLTARYTRSDGFLKMGDKLIERDPYVSEWVQSLTRRRQSARDVDLYMGSRDRSVGTSVLKGVSSDAANARCSAVSPWIDVRTDVVVNDDNVAFKYEIENKRRWITADALRSPAFDDFLRDAEKCASIMRVPMRLISATKDGGRPSAAVD